MQGLIMEAQVLSQANICDVDLLL